MLRKYMEQENQNDNVAQNEPIKFGCIFFDLKEVTINGVIKKQPSVGSGWVSIEGQSSYRIKEPNLQDNIIWITNLSTEIMWKLPELKKLTNLKPSSYLRADIGQIMKELGLNTKQNTTAEICELISGIFNKVMKAAIEFYKLDTFEESGLSEELKKKIIPQDESISNHLDEALLRSYQDIVICELDPDKKDKQFVTLKRPRLLHAKKVLEISIPSNTGDWITRVEDELPETQSERISFLLNQEKPFVARININSFHSNSNMNLSKLLNLGEAIGQGGKKRERNWVSQPEFLYLSKFADITIEGAFIANNYETLSYNSGIVELGELSHFSYSLGLLAECYWVGLSSRSVNSKTKSKTLVSPRACWIKASDRFLTFTSAMILASSGFTVVSYGTGGVTLLVKETQIQKLIEIAPIAGLTVPMNLFKPTEVFSKKTAIEKLFD